MMSVVIMLVLVVLLLPLSSARLVVTSEADLYLETGQLDTQRQTCQPCLTMFGSRIVEFNMTLSSSS